MATMFKGTTVRRSVFSMSNHDSEFVLCSEFLLLSFITNGPHMRSKISHTKYEPFVVDVLFHVNSVKSHLMIAIVYYPTFIDDVNRMTQSVSKMT